MIVKVKLPSLFVLSCMKHKEINLVQVFIAHKVLSRTHFNIHRKELTEFLKDKYSYPHINLLLKQWQAKPFINYNEDRETYSFAKNVEEYYNQEYIEHDYKKILKFSLEELPYTGNTLARFLYVEIMFRTNCSMTREFITNITGLTKPTQIKAEKEFNVTVTPQFIEMKEKIYDFTKINRKCLKIDNIHYLQHTNHYSYVNCLGKLKRVKRDICIRQSIYKAKPRDFVYCFDRATKGIKTLFTGELFNRDYILSF
jgi:hypothetical protein